MLSNTRSLGLDLEHSTRSLITIDRTEVVINLNIAKKVEAIQKTIKKNPKLHWVYKLEVSAIRENNLIAEVLILQRQVHFCSLQHAHNLL